MESQDTMQLLLKADYCVCNHIHHYFLSDPVIIFDCCCPEVVPSGSFSMEIPTKPPILHFKCKLSDSAITNIFQNDPCFKYFKNPENFVLMCDASNESHYTISAGNYNFEGKECIEECINYHKMGYYPSDNDNSCFDLEAISADLDFLDQMSAGPKISSYLTSSDEKQESGAEKCEENLMKIMDFVFRDMESNQLDRILDDISHAQATDM